MFRRSLSELGLVFLMSPNLKNLCIRSEKARCTKITINSGGNVQFVYIFPLISTLEPNYELLSVETDYHRYRSFIAVYLCL